MKINTAYVILINAYKYGVFRYTDKFRFYSTDRKTAIEYIKSIDISASYPMDITCKYDLRTLKKDKEQY